MACSPDDCTVVLYALSDPRLETFTNQGDPEDTDVRTYTVPQPNDSSGTYGAYPNPEMRDSFASDIQRAMAQHPTRQEQGCGKGCGCSESTDPKDAMQTRRRISFSAQFTYRDGNHATLTGSYLLTATRIKGFCTPGSTAKTVTEQTAKGPVADDCGKPKRASRKRSASKKG